MKSCGLTTVGIALAGALAVSPALAQRDFSKVQIRTTDLGKGLYMMQGAGGNLGVSTGPDGVFLIDDDFTPLTPKIKAAIAKVSDKPVRFLINTHWHFDHTGGNEALGKGGAAIVAHENVRKRMKAGQMIKAFNMMVKPAKPHALPIVTFARSVKFHMNGLTIEAEHHRPGHTDGDSVIWFREANVLHTGDVFFNGIYPFIDSSSGGSLDGVIAVVETLLPTIRSDTKIIPGHGPLAKKGDLVKYLAMLKAVRSKVVAAKKNGKDAKAFVASKPTAELDATWGKGFLKPAQFQAIAFGATK